MELNHKITGHGQPLIIAHGLFGSLDNWVTLGKSLSEHYMVCLIDQRNHGRSGWSEEWDYASMAADLKEFIEQHQLESPVIIGHSMGGKTAMRFAAEYPEMLSKLIVVDIAPKYYPVHHQDILHALNSLDMSKVQSRKEAEMHMGQWIKYESTKQFLLKNLYRNEQNEFAWRINLKVITEKIENVGEDIPDYFPRPLYRKPTLFIRGEHSDYILDDDFEDIHQCFSDAKIITIPGAGHWVHAEQPQKLLEALLDFLEEN